MAEPVSERRFEDAALNVNVALPNAANTVNTNYIDLGSNTPYPVQEGVVAVLYTTAGNGANTKNINCRIQHSNEASANYVNVASLGQLQVTEGSGSYAASNLQVILPPDTRRYIRATALGEANGGNAANGLLGLKLAF